MDQDRCKCLYGHRRFLNSKVKQNRYRCRYKLLILKKYLIQIIEKKKGISYGSAVILNNILNEIRVQTARHLKDPRRISAPTPLTEAMAVHAVPAHRSTKLTDLL